MFISDIAARVNLSSMGNETVETIITDDSGHTTIAAVPAGISAGKYEAKTVPAQEAIAEIERVRGTISGKDWDQKTLDEHLVSLGIAGNSTLAISVTFWKSQLTEEPKYAKFPILLLLMFEGGKHGNESLTIQEFTIQESLLSEAIVDFKLMRKHLKENNISTTVGVEGAFSPAGFGNEDALRIIKELFTGKKISLDVAGSFENENINFDKLMAENNIGSIEDPYDEEAWAKWEEFYNKYKEKILIIGDDLTATNTQRINKALNPRVISGVIIKPNQNGTISGTMEAVRTARENDLKVVFSHRGEDTDDDWLVDLALTAQADYVKFGGMERGERIAKYNRLLELGMK